MEPLTISIKAAMAALGLGRTSIFRLISERKLQVVRIGRRDLVKIESIRELVKADPEGSAREGSSR